MASSLSLQRVSKRLGSASVLDDVSLEVPAGAVLALVGESGSGKTTLLRSLNGLTSIDAGRIEVAGHVIGPQGTADPLGLRRDVGMVFQQFHLWGHRTVLQNVADAPVCVKGLDRSRSEESARTLLARVGLLDLAARYPHQLSGGQQQRVAIARALAMDPQVLLFDEVTSALDRRTAREVLAVSRGLAADRSRTLVLVTHELIFARETADLVAFLDGGRLVEIGPTERLFTQAREARSREFLSHVNRAEGEYRASTA